MSTRIARRYPYTVHLVEGDVRMTLARLTLPQFEEFSATFDAMSKGRGNPAMKPPSEDESEEEARARLASHVAYLQTNAAWIAETLRNYVQIIPGDLVLAGEHGQPDEVVTDGARFAELYPSDASNLLAELWLQNGLTAAQKKTLASRRASATGWTTESSPMAHGQRPETTAAPVELEDSAPPEDATASSSDGSSGTTALSDSEPVLSEP